MESKKRTNTIRPRPHQRTAIRDILKVFETNNRTQIHMACGTGKTLIAAWVAQKLRSRKTLVLLPSIALIHQMFAAFVRATPKGWSGAVVCGPGEEFSAKNNQSLAVLSSNKEIRQFLQGNSTQIVFCTYQSSSKLDGTSFDFGVFDEAHRTAGHKDKSFAFANTERNVKILKRIFMTATPRIRSLIKNDSRSHNDMGNETLFGPVAHVLSFQAAVAKNIVCDYKIIISVQDIPLDHEAPTSLQVATSQAMSKYDIRKVITFHRTVAEAQNFIVNSSHAFASNVELHHVNGAQKSKDRNSNMTAFKSASRAVMSNARCLTEGVDIPSVDLVVFASKKSSTVDIVQAAGRSMRKDPSRPQKEFGYILVPLFVQPEVSDEEAVRNSEFGEIFKVLTAMSELDEALAAKLLTKSSLADRILLTNSSTAHGVLSKESLDRLEDLISVRIINRAYISGTKKERYRKIKDQLLAIARRGARRPSTKTSTIETRRLAHHLPIFIAKGDAYDEVFSKEIRRIAPSWFQGVDSVQLLSLKKKVSDFAKTGESRASLRKGTKEEKALYFLIRDFVAPSGRYNDEVFAKKLRNLAPQWFQRVDAKHLSQEMAREQILLLAKSGKEKPIKGSLAGRLNKFIRPVSLTYDEAFHRTLAEVAPHWFKRTVTLMPSDIDTRKELLSLAKSGKERPTKNLLYRLKKLTSQDKAFEAKLTKIAPHWFANEEATKIKHDNAKKEILLIAKSGGDKNHPIIKKFFRLFCLPSGCFYDKAFEAKLTKIAPHWFANEEVRLLKLKSAKKQLVLAVKAGKNRDNKTVNKLLKKLTTPSGRNYDEALTRRLKKIAPDLFKRTLLR